MAINKYLGTAKLAGAAALAFPVIAPHALRSSPTSGLPTGYCCETAHFMRIANLTWVTVTVTANGNFWNVADSLAPFSEKPEQE